MFEVSGRNPERQDHIIGPNKASSFSGYFVARFDKPFVSYGTATNNTLHPGELQRQDKIVSAYVNFPEGSEAVTVRIGVSFISIDQARRNLDKEIPDKQTLESTARATRTAWAEKLDRIQVEGGTTTNKTTFYTAFFHSLQARIYYSTTDLYILIFQNNQYPYEQSEDGRYYSGYDDSIHTGMSYTGYSIWVCVSLYFFAQTYSHDIEPNLSGYLSCRMDLAYTTCT
jgi:putative alpha-1,2-mannosidase